MNKPNPKVLVPMSDSEDSQKSSTQYGWGIVGTGNIALKFAQDLPHVPGAKKIAVYSRTDATGAGFAAQNGFQRSYDNLAEFLADDAIDIVYIATPHIAHMEQALRAIKAGKSVLIEKPIAMTAEEAHIIGDASREYQVFAMEALWSRFLPTIQRAKAIIDSGRLGKVRHAKASLIYHRAYDENDRLYAPKLGGGVMHDLGVYPISVATYLLGQPALQSSQWYPAPNGVNNAADVELMCGNVPVSISTGFSHDGENTFSIFGTKGTLRIERHFLRSDAITVWDEQKETLPDTSGSLVNKVTKRLGLHGGKKERFPLIGNGLHYQASAVQAAIGQGLISHPVMPVDESAAVMKIIEAVLAKPASV